MSRVTRMIGSLAVLGVFAAGVADVRGVDWSGHVTITEDTDLTLENNMSISSLWVQNNKLTLDSDNDWALTANSGRYYHWANFNIVGNGSGNDATLNIHEGASYTMGGTNFGVGIRGGHGTVNIDGGTLQTDEFYMAHGGSGQGTINMYDGTLNIRHYWVIGNGVEPAPSTFNMYGGTLLHGSHGGRVHLEAGVFNMYGGSVTLDRDTRIGQGGHSGTFRAWLDGSGFDTVTVNNVLRLNRGTAILDVAFPGGVMLSGTDSFDLIHANSLDGTWNSLPDHLWNTTTSGGDVTVALNTAYKRGTLNASDMGDSVSMVEGQRVYGFIEMPNQDQLDNVQLLLDFVWDDESNEEDTWNLFTGDLGEAGYTVLDQTTDYMEPWLSLAMDMDGISTEYFAWDLRNYHGSAQLELQSVTVVPEPGTWLLLLSALACGLLVRRRRGKE